MKRGNVKAACLRLLLAVGIVVQATAFAVPAAHAASLSCAEPMVMMFTISAPDIKSVAFTLTGGTGAVTVDWGGSGAANPVGATGLASDQVQSYNTGPGQIGFTYTNYGSYTVRVCGTVDHFQSSNQQSLTAVQSFGNLGITDFSDAFFNTPNLVVVPNILPSSAVNLSRMFHLATALNQPIGGWDTSHVTNMSGMFWGADSFDQPIGDWNTSHVTNLNNMFCDAWSFNQPIDSWDTSRVTDMSGMFFQTGLFDQPIGAWTTSSVTDMSSMFGSSMAFDQPIGAWDTSSVTDMVGMFNGAKAFDQPIDAWNTSHVTDMSFMFEGAAVFNQPIGAWATGSVTNLNEMFYRATSFDQPVGAWNTSSVIGMRSVFEGAVAFNQPIGAWDTSHVVDMSHMFSGAAAFNQPIGAWDTSQVHTMYGMFCGASTFNQPIGTWNTGKVENMVDMFCSTAAFNQPIGAWDTGNVTNMSYMFANATAFNQPVGTWDTSNVSSMGGLFASAKSFDQPIGAWDTSNVTYMGPMLDDSGLSVSNYDELLTGWASRTQHPGLFLGAESIHYSTVGSAGRSRLVDTFDWEIEDGGMADAGSVTGSTPTFVTSPPAVDRALGTLPGSWGPSGVVLTYQWYRRSPSGSVRAVAGATSDTYTPKASDVGYKLRVKLTGSLAGFTSVSKTSSYTSAVTRAVFSSAPTPSVSGVARVSMPLTAVPGTWEPAASLKYQWYRVSATGASSAITGATKMIYTATSSDKGRQLKVRVKGYRSGYLTTTRYSALTTAVLPGMVGVTPKVSDTTPKVDQELTADEGIWSLADVVFSYQWYAKSQSGRMYAISGATARSYRVDGKYAGYKIKVKVTGAKIDYAPVSKTSAYTYTVVKATFTNKPVPTISGTPQVGQTLTAVPGEWVPNPTSFRYVWYRSGTVITGVTGNTHLLGAGDRGKVITVRATAVRSGYVSASVKSAATTPVAT